MHHDTHEVNKFNDLAHNWWNLEGEFKTLHHINPLRLDFVIKHTGKLTGKHIIDIGCGGGIFSEALAASGATVTGVDLAPQSIEVAKLHLYESGLKIDYQCIDVAKVADDKAESFDIVTAMELLEHVPNPERIIEQCAKLLKPGGIAFFSTLNRNLKSYLLGVLAAEYILNLVPKGTHDYQKFIKPSELRHMLDRHGLVIIDIKGVSYNPLTQIAKITTDPSINYMVCCQKQV